MTYFLIFGLLGFLILGVPVGFAMGLVCAIYFLSSGTPLAILSQQIFQGTNVFVLVAVPLFMAASQLMNEGQITKKLIRLSNAFLGHITGALSLINIVVSMLFAGMSGSSIADSAGIGKALIPSMLEEGYERDFSAAVTASSSVVGPIIPPSIPMVVTGAIAGVSVGRLFLGGAIPGVLFGVLLMITSYIISRIRNYPKHDRSTLKEILISLKEAFLPLLMPVILLGGIFSGVFTPTESAGVAVAYGLFLATIVYRMLSIKKILTIAYEISIQTATIMFIVGMANVYGYILTRERIPQMISQNLFSITTNEHIIMLLIIFSIIIIGCFLSTTPTLMLTIPILIPIVGQFGFDPLHFFVVITLAACMGTITPPVGLTLYVASSIAEVSVEKTLVAMLPFLAMLLLVALIALFVPSIVTYLPTLLN